MSLIAIIGQLDFHPEDAAAAADFMRTMMNESMKEEGCRHYTFASDLSTPNRFQLSELWDSDEALAAHFQAGHMTTYRAGIGKLRVIARRVERFAVAETRAL